MSKFRIPGTLTMEQAERLLLSNCPAKEGVIRTGDLLAKSERGKYGTHNLNAAYWSLVSKHKLIRVPNGVYRVAYTD